MNKNIITKICNICSNEKSINEYYIDKTKKDGYRASCKSCDLKRAQIYRNNNKEKVSLGKKLSYNKKIEHYLSKASIYRKNNKINRNIKEKERRLNDPLHKLKVNLRNLIGNSLRNKNYKKVSKTHEILGCSFEEFKEYLESKFEPWMTWDNRGLYNGTPEYGWDIDHVIPTSSSTTEEELIRLNHYTNLRPLCSYNNRYIKKNK
jgi:hypothetical protein